MNRPFSVTQRGSLALTLDISEKGFFLFSRVCNCCFLIFFFQLDVSLLFMHNFSVCVIIRLSKDIAT